MREKVGHTPAEAFHPSEFIAEELEARGWSQHDLAARMAGDPAVNFLTLDTYRLVGPTDPRMRLGKRTAIALGEAFGVSADLFLNLEAAWRAHHVH